VAAARTEAATASGPALAELSAGDAFVSGWSPDFVPVSWWPSAWAVRAESKMTSNGVPSGSFPGGAAPGGALAAAPGLAGAMAGVMPLSFDIR
jgi:hypothetical protein